MPLGRRRGSTEPTEGHVMEKNNRPGQEESGVPGPQAELMISIGPAPQQWGTARGLVPADQAHHLITTFGILGSVVTGTGGAVFTLHADAIALAYAELALALVAVVLIALCGRAGVTVKRRQALAKRRKHAPARTLPR
jgi:hypothetical protein